MRKFYIRSGNKFAGEYNLYESEKEFREIFPNEYLFKWHRDDYHKLAAGMWCEAEDGYIMECLAAYKLVNKAGRITYCFRMVNYLATVYIKSNGEPRWSKWLGYISALYPSRLANGNFNGDKEIKIKFAAFVMAGMPLKQAYMLANKTKNYALVNSNKIIRLMNDPIIIHQMKDHLQLLKDGIENRFSAARLIQEIDDLITQSQKGSDAHRKNIQFILELKGIINNKTKHEIEDAKYEDQTPPFVDEV